jgi:hypothetical protein
MPIKCIMVFHGGDCAVGNWQKSNDPYNAQLKRLEVK